MGGSRVSRAKVGSLEPSRLLEEDVVRALEGNSRAGVPDLEAFTGYEVTDVLDDVSLVNRRV